MAKKDFSKIPIQFTRFDKEVPYSRSLSLMAELLENIYWLMFHPIYGDWRYYKPINHFKPPLQGEFKYHRTYFERTIHQAKAMSNIKINGMVQTLTSEETEHALEHIVHIWKKLNEMYSTPIEEENNADDRGIDFFRIASGGYIKYYAIWFADTCNHMMLTEQINLCKLELSKVPQGDECAKWLYRMQANTEQRKDQLDNIIYNGMMKWIGIELEFYKKVSTLDEVSNEIRAIIESYLEEKKTRRSNHQLLQFLMDELLDEFCDGLSKLVMDVFSYLEFTDEETEKVYHAMLGGLLNSFSTEYKLSSNKESGLGRYDLVLTPNHLGFHGVVIEIKKIKLNEIPRKDEVLDSAITQIKTKQYFNSLKQAGHTKCIAIAAACCGKQLFLKHEVLDI